VKLSVHPVKTGQARLGLPGNVVTITRSAFFPAHPAKAGQSRRLACKLELREVLSLWEKVLYCDLSGIDALK
jgi:hypothetical protein